MIDALRIGGLHRLDGVAGVDRPLEGVGRDDPGDVGDLHHVEKGGDPRHDVLADGGRRRDDARRSRRRAIRSARRAVRRAGGRGRRPRRGSTLATPASLAASAATAAQSLPATSMWTSPPSSQRRGSGRAGGGFAQRGVVVVGNQQRRHRTLASFFSLSTSSATLATLTPLRARRRLGDADAPSAAAPGRCRARPASSRRSASSWPS